MLCRVHARTRAGRLRRARSEKDSRLAAAATRRRLHLRGVQPNNNRPTTVVCAAPFTIYVRAITCCTLPRRVPFAKILYVFFFPINSPIIFDNDILHFICYLNYYLSRRNRSACLPSISYIIYITSREENELRCRRRNARYRTDIVSSSATVLKQ